MSKPVTGKTHVGERRERRPNGDIYLYERVTAYNEQASAGWSTAAHMVPRQSAGKAVRAVCLTGVSLLSDEENQGNARRAWKEQKRKDRRACQARKSTGQVA